MFLGKVVGSVWSTKKQPQLSGLKFLLVVPIHLTGTQSYSAGPESGIIDFFQKFLSRTISPLCARKLQAISTRTMPEMVRAEIKKIVLTEEIELSLTEQNMVSSFLAGSGEGVVVTDRLDAGIGDTVVVAFGKAARIGIGDPDMPIEAAVVAIVDEISIFDGSEGENDS
ncbi:EutN/CcmL family microcompartment protein [candidate division CSSED10-310 bacterium]|uniref:EutN/CcmL family microcompartment protein n=1 Tax=candidate division CSSED10-310 bacterium TaxID=2855610 RepID=A0ABV6Z213_UNCC1